jgi:uncharacterized protein (TIGR02757 family)
MEHAAELLEKYYTICHQAVFVEDDPISIPHRFSTRQDIEIMGFFAAILSWGQRVTIINNCRKLSALMDERPFEFIQHHSQKDLRPLESFVHRTFNSTDLLGLIAFFRQYYSTNESLQEAFSNGISAGDEHVGPGIQHFHDLIMHTETTAARTKKHLPAPSGKSTCKRINMYLRWMVRQDDAGIDFGIWKNILPSQLICPLDVHVERHARRLGLITRKQTDWQTALELSKRLRQIDPVDPVRFDFALFGMGILEKKGLMDEPFHRLSDAP